MNTVGLILASVIMGVVGQLVLKAGVASIGPLALGGGGATVAAWRIATNYRIWGGLGLYGVSTFFWLVVLSRVELGYAYPFISLSYVLIVFFSWWLFKEEVSLVRLLGVAAICLGVYVVATG